MPANTTPAVAYSANEVEQQPTTLSSLPIGARGRVQKVLSSATEALRLRSLGLCDGREVEVLRTGNAFVIRVLDSRIGISSRLAESVLLTVA